MAKNEIPIIEIADDGTFSALVAAYQKKKDEKDAIQKEMDVLFSKIEKYTGIDPEAPKEGTLKLHSGNTTVNVEFKMNHTVDEEKALKLCEKKGLSPWEIFNIKVEYPTKTQQGTFNYAEEEVRADIHKILAESSTSKRGKSQLKITIK